VTGEWMVFGSGEERVVGLTVMSAGPGSEDGCGVAVYRGDAFFPALAETSDVGSGAEVDVPMAKGNELGCSEPGSKGEQDQGVVTSP
jgi:hypothetical protein